MVAAPHDLDLVDAAAPGIGSADLILVYGTLHPTPAVLAAEQYHAGRAPRIVLTGGPNRATGQVEADLHAQQLESLGVPTEAVLLERRSVNTWENVDFASDLLRQTGRPVRSIIAVVKWYHRRALLITANRMPEVERIFAVDYEPYDPVTGLGVSRSGWRTGSVSLARETAYMRDLIAQGWDPLQRGGLGWVRTRPSTWV